MTLSGLDPTGGAGTQADIEAIASMGCHAAPLVTAMTIQDTHGVRARHPVDPALLVEQAEVVLADMPVRAFKIGLLPDLAVVEAVRAILAQRPNIPVVLDPVLASGRGDPLVGESVLAAMVTRLLPLTSVLTPNTPEARQLAPGTTSLEAAAQVILAHGPDFVLITGTHEQSREVVNTLHARGCAAETFSWPRLAHSYHGSGCTLAAAIAGLLAHGLDPFTAIHDAQEYTWESLRHGYRAGTGQYIPNRLFWARRDESAAG